MKQRFCIILVSLLLLSMSSFASDVDDTMNGIFNPQFKTLQVNVGGNDYAPPVITLGSDDRVIISFDELT